MKFNLDEELKKWRKSLYKNEALEDGYVEELESHLRDEIEQAIETGVNAEKAFHNAVTNLGHTDEIGAEFHKTQTRRLSGRPPWNPSRMAPSLMWSYIRLTLRKIRRQKGYSLINIAGLALGMACCILILTWVQDEYSYDRFHQNSSRIFRVNSEIQAGGEVSYTAGSPAPVGKALVEEYPEILNSVRVQAGWERWYFHYEDVDFIKNKLAAVDASFFEIFSFPFLKGDPETALREPHSMVLTESLAKKCFGDEDPMGKIIQKDDDVDMIVTGVIADIPRNSHIQFDYAFPAENMRQWRESKLDSWNYLQFATYIQVKENVNLAELNKKITDIAQRYSKGSRVKVTLQPLTDIHLNSSHMNFWMTPYPNPGNLTFVVIFTLVAICVLLIACINFMNLATARYGTRAKEVGMRKVVGARRKDLIKQFMGESCVLAVLSLIIAILLVLLFLPAFNQLAGKEMSLDLTGSIFLWIGLLGIALFTGLISGSYPALFLSSFSPTHVFRIVTYLGAHRGGRLRKLLVVVQFVFTIALIICTTVIYSQLQFIQTKDLGYDTRNLISFAAYGKFRGEFETVRSELLQNPRILNACSAFPPSGGVGQPTIQVDWEGKDPSQEVRFYSDYGDYDFLDTFGLQMVAGRFYSRDFPTDTDNFVVNETAVKTMGYENPIGESLTFKGKKGSIIGVVKDYHGRSLHEPIRSLVIESGGGFFVCVKYQPGTVAETIAFLEKKWNQYVPGEPFQYGFVDESIENFYTNERRISKIFRNFTILAVFIACLGLFGLASFMAERRTKEIGIRKVMGARIWGIILMLSKEFVKWVLMANLIAWPIAYLLSKRWLQGFAYRINLGLDIFVFSAVLALFIAVLTVSYQAIRAATADPVQSLRYE